MSRPWPGSRATAARGHFDLVPRAHPTANSLCPPPGPSTSSNGGPGYTLGGAASAAASREKQDRENELKIAAHKEKEREKKMKKLEEKLKRNPSLDIATAPGYHQHPSVESLTTVREMQKQKNEGAIERYKIMQIEHKAQENHKQKEKIEEKAKKYPYLKTTPGLKLRPDVFPERGGGLNSSTLQIEPVLPLNKDEELKKRRQQLQDKYSSSLKQNELVVSDLEVEK